MRDWLRWLAELRGIEVAPDAELRLELLGAPTGGLALLLLVALLAVGVGVAAMYRREGGLAGRRWWLPALLRCAAIGAAILILLEPSLVTVRRDQRPGHVILMVDASRSMAQRDAFVDRELADLRQQWSAVGVTDGPDGTSRWERAIAVLRHNDFAVVRALSGRHRLMAYAFAGGLEPVPVDAAGTGPPIDLDTLQPTGPQTDFGGVRVALERSRDAAVAGVVLLSDGRSTSGPSGPEVARWFSQRKVPHVLVLPIGDPLPTKAVRLSRLDAPAKVFQRDPFAVGARLSSTGYPSTPVTVRLLRKGPAGTSDQEVARRTVTVGGDLHDTSVRFDGLRADRAGFYTYGIQIVPPVGEPAQPERHIAWAQIEALSERTKVLLLSGGPSHEFRFAERELTRDKTIETRCWLQSADPNFPQDGNASIRSLPRDRAALQEIDVIVLFDPDPLRLSADFCAAVAQHVTESGAGLWWVAGEKFTLEALRPAASTAPLAELLPVVPDLVKADRDVVQFGRGFRQAWPWTLTAAGRGDAIVELLETPETNAEVWPRLPGYHFAFPVQRAKPGATTLLAIDEANPLRGAAGEAAPLLARQSVGAGRVLYTGTDETYRWRSAYREAYQRFWVQGVRFLFEGRLTAGSSRFRLRLADERVELGTGVAVTAEVRDAAQAPVTAATVDVMATHQDGRVERLVLHRVAEAPGEYRAVFRPGEVGFYTLRPAEPPPGRAAEVSLQAVAPALEKEGPTDLAELASIATTPGGQLLSDPTELLSRVRNIPSLQSTLTYRSAHSIWDTWATVAALLALLAGEWLLRKRANLL